MFMAAAVAILATMALALIRAFLGPTIYDRILAVNMFGTKTVLIIAVAGFGIALSYSQRVNARARSSQAMRSVRMAPPGPAMTHRSR